MDKYWVVVYKAQPGTNTIWYKQYENREIEASSTSEAIDVAAEEQGD